MSNTKNSQLEQEIIHLVVEKLGLDKHPAVMSYPNTAEKALSNLSKEIISLVKNSGAMGISNNCICDDSQDSHMDKEGYIVCGDCDKRYGNTSDKYGSQKIMLNWELGEKSVSEFWYFNQLGKQFKVRPCLSKGDVRDMEGVGKYDISELYIVIDGEYRTNAILKKHCKVI